jgi:hypothetical protein
MYMHSDVCVRERGVAGGGPGDFNAVWTSSVILSIVIINMETIFLFKE